MCHNKLLIDSDIPLQVFSISFVCLVSAFCVCLSVLSLYPEYVNSAVSLANVVNFIVGDTQQQATLIEYVCVQLAFDCCALNLAHRAYRLQRVLHSVLSARIILNLRKLVFGTIDEGPKDLTTVIFGELISDPSSSSGYSTQRTQEEEDMELQDLPARPAQVTSVIQNIITTERGPG